MKNKKLNYCLFLFALLFSFVIFSHTGFAKQTTQQAFKALFDEYKIQLAGFLGIGICISIISFIVNFVKLGMYGSNGSMRGMIIRNLFISGICTAFLGSISLIIVLVINLFFQADSKTTTT